MKTDGSEAGRNHTPPDDAPPQRIAADIVQSFLSAMERRDLDAARTYLSPNFVMIFPGNARFTDLQELVSWGQQRYRAIGKSYTRFDAVDDGETTIVYCFGTLHGIQLDGTEFNDIRFIDRFTVCDDTLLDQQVWNDMGEVLGSA